MRPLGGAAVVAVLWAIPGCGTKDPEVQVVHGDAVAHGAALFTDPKIAKNSFNTYSCASCHDPSPPGGATLRPGAPMAGVLERPTYWDGQELDLLRAVNDCLYYFMLKDDPWTPDDPDARAIYAYLESLSPAGDPGASEVPFTVVRDIVDLPAGDAGKGAAVYKSACALCHGEIHSGAGKLVPRAPSLPEQTLEEHPPPDYSDTDRRLVFIEKLRHGAFLGYSGQMPPFSEEKLSDAEVADVLAFLKLY